LNALRIKHYDQVNQYTSDLLDDYMEWKNNLSMIQDVLANPSAYEVSDIKGAINISVDALVAERKKTKKQMADIVKEIERM
jgi:gas vesicle protein